MIYVCKYVFERLHTTASSVSLLKRHMSVGVVTTDFFYDFFFLVVQRANSALPVQEIYHVVIFINGKIYTLYTFNGACRFFADRIYCFILSVRHDDNRRCCERHEKNNAMEFRFIV